MLIAIIASVLVLSAGGYFGVKQYQDYQIEKVEKESEAKIIVETQQKALEQAQAEIEKLKSESTATKQNQQALEKTVNNSQQLSQNTSISASDLSPYLSGVMQITCGGISGSVSLWKSMSGMPPYAVLTNKHVIEGITGSCLLFPGTDSFSDSNSVAKIMATTDPKQTYRWNSFTDIAVLSVDSPFAVKDNCEGDCSEAVSKDKLNYSISTLRKCPEKMPIGSPVIAVGFPAFGMTSDSASHRISSNGIISGYNSRDALDRAIPYSNYFTSAKIDSGNSGGIAFSKTSSGLCVLGVPTWISVGNYETNGLIQNIHNVMSR